MRELLKRVYDSKKISTALKIISHVSVLGGVIAYLAIVIHAFLSDTVLGIKLIFSAGVPFVLVSILRRIIDAPRPYELYDFYEKKPKDKKGRSFPSRHVFSAFVIAMLSFPSSPALGAALCVLGIALAVSRVLLGIHFIRDVAAGALIGILSGALGILIVLT